jgi:hypothetical protein
VMTRVVQWGTGNVGRHALRGVLERPDLELVGLRVFDPAKVGVDAGALLGADPIGVVATDDTDEIVALDADVVLHNSLGTTLVDLQGPVDELSTLLESGKNVISSAVDLFLYLKPGVAPAYVTPELVAQLRAACEAGGSSIYGTGVTPGFALDLWPVTMGRVVRRVEAVRVTELVSLRHYRSSTVGFMGFGLPPDADVEMFKMFVESPADPAAGAINTPYGAALHFVGDAFGVDIDSITFEVVERRTAATTLELPGGTFDAGTVVGVQFRLTGWAGGSPFVTYDFCWRIDDEGWSPNLCAWELEIDGDPAVRSRMEFATETDARRATSITVAGHCLNAIPKVVDAPPGILNHFTVPVFTGRGAPSLRASRP